MQAEAVLARQGALQQITDPGRRFTELTPAFVLHIIESRQPQGAANRGGVTTKPPISSRLYARTIHRPSPDPMSTCH
ncbi:hypothetical protein MTOK_34060 [Mycolicibacterium tokaiense]|nr:hypothetical protein MTOK_34060 [Mycolicibacterium tokaiense]